MKPWKLAPIAVTFGLLACSRGYLSVVVTAATPALATDVVQLLVTASDAAADGGPILLPQGTPLAGGLEGLPDASIVFVVQSPPGATVSVFVQGLGADGGVIAANGETVSSITSGSHIDLTLMPACSTNRDCDLYDEVCQGRQLCTPQGFCGPPVGQPVFLDAGAPCGPCSAGSCDGNGTCLLGDCGCLFTFPDSGMGYIFNTDAGEQCDDGNGPDGGNSDTLPDHCRTNCHFASCGDGVRDPDAGELCDFDAGNNGKGLGCNATCNLLGLVSTVAGDPGVPGFKDGIGSSALFEKPYGVAVLDGLVYVADTYYRAIRQVNPDSGAVVTLAGGITSCNDVNGQGTAGTFCDLNALTVFDGGLIATDDSCLRFVTTSGDVTSWAGQLATGAPATGIDAGPFPDALFGVPQGIAAMNGIVYTDSNLNGYVLASNPGTQAVNVLDIVGTQAILLGGMTALDNLIYMSVNEMPGVIYALDTSGGATQLSATAHLEDPFGVCNDGRSIYICESGTGNIRQYDTDAGTLSLLAGSGMSVEQDGLGIGASFDEPAGCVYDPAAKRLYVTDKFGCTLRVIQ